MNRLGVTSNDWVKELATGADFIMSHLACADEPSNLENKKQLNKFLQMTSELNIPRSLSATAGILLGNDYHFDLTRPGIGLYGGFPFSDSEHVVSLDIPVIQTKVINKGESIGYGASFIAQKKMTIATISAGYADGIIRSLSKKAIFYHEGIPCRVVGRISMDLITVDISKLENEPNYLNFIGPSQSIDQVAKISNTIGHEILTSLGNRYSRIYK
jgi:alanine racemase